MGREIKFRAWNTQKKRMSYQDGTGSQPLIFRIDGALTLVDKYNNSEYQYKCEHNLFITDEEGGNYHTEDFLLMQYTGLKDKNGKEIYEGDIVKIRDYYAEVGVVEYNPPRFNIFDNDDSTTDFDNIKWKYFEVIGNIYENPDLLSKLKED